MRKEMLAVGLALTLVATAFGASAFTSASVTQNANIEVASDQNALIGFTAGGAGGQMVYNEDGSLQIDTGSLADAEGVNANATYTLGNASDVGSSTPVTAENAAFVVTNNDNTAHQFDFSYSNDSDSSGSVAFDVYTNPGGVNGSDHTDEGTVNATNSVTTSSLENGEKAYVVVHIDTQGMNESDSLSGSLTVETTAAA